MLINKICESVCYRVINRFCELWITGCSVVVGFLYRVVKSMALLCLFYTNRCIRLVLCIKMQPFKVN